MNAIARDPGLRAQLRARGAAGRPTILTPHPLEAAEVSLEEREGMPGQYEARFFLRPHYQLEGMSVALRLVSRLPSK